MERKLYEILVYLTVNLFNMAEQSTDQTLGEKICFFRKRRKMSQFELEIEAKLSSGTISKLENNRKTATNKTLLRIAKVLELDIKETAYLLDVNFYIDEKITRQVKEGKKS